MPGAAISGAARRYCEAIAILALTVLGVVIFRAGEAIPPSFMDTGFGAGLLPKWLGIIIVVLSVALLLEIMGRRKSVERADAQPEAFYIGPGIWRPCALVALLVLLIVNAEHAWVPFYLSVAVFLFGVMLLLQGLSRRSVAIAAVVTVVMTAVVWFVFAKLFMVIVQ